MNDLIKKITAPNGGVFTGQGTNSYLIGKDDITLMGFSQGGSICWKLGLDYSERFRRVIPISSFIHPSYLNEDLDYYRELLIYSSHGTQDEVIPINLVEGYIESLSKSLRKFRCHNDDDLSRYF